MQRRFWNEQKTNRIEKLSDAYQVVIKLTDTEYADQLFLRNPLIILDDEVL